MIRKSDLYNRAVNLRQRGFSYSEILESVSVAQSTISRWCHDITLTDSQINRLMDKKRSTPLIVELKNRAIETRKNAEIWASEQIRDLNKSKNALLLVSGTLLYWAEGTKGPKKSSIEFTNTDGRIIKIMMDFFREAMLVPENKFHIMVRIGEKGNAKEAEEYWCKLTNVPKENFHRPEMLKLTEKSKSLQKYPYGICRISIYDIAFYTKMVALIEELNKVMPS